jgi:hypothetical protein
VEVEALAGVVQYPRDVLEVDSLVTFKEVLLHVEGLEDKANVLLRVAFRSPKRVVARRYLRP